MAAVCGQKTKPHALLLAGPTASGKSRLALALAERLGGVIINADAMQVYAELRIITARPSEQDEARAPHALYGVRPAREPGSAAWWREAALAAMAAARRAGRLPILCGGTGLYFLALTRGLADIPDPGEAARAEARQMLAEQGPQALHAALARVDQATAARLHPRDSQRLARAWEVWRGTGRGLAAWQALPPAPPGWRFTGILLDPPRDALGKAIGRRLDRMWEQGMAQEVALLRRQRLPASLPAMRALGVPEMIAYLDSELTAAEATSRIMRASWRYIRRQATWFRHHPLAEPARTRIITASVEDIAQFSASEWADLLAFVQPPG